MGIGYCHEKIYCSAATAGADDSVAVASSTFFVSTGASSSVFCFLLSSCSSAGLGASFLFEGDSDSSVFSSVFSASTDFSSLAGSSVASDSAGFSVSLVAFSGSSAGFSSTGV